MMVDSYFLLFTTLKPPYLGVRPKFLENEAECVYVVDENVSVALTLPTKIC